MSIEEFNKLKVGDMVYVTNRWDKKTVTMVEVTGIDKFFKKVRPLLGTNGRYISYRFVHKKTDKPCTGAAGVCKAEQSFYL